MAGYGFNIGLDGRSMGPLTEREAEEIAGGLAEIYSQARETMLKQVSSRLARGVTQHGWAERKAAEVLDAHHQLERIYDRAARQRDDLLKNVVYRAMATGNEKFYTDMKAILGNVQHISPNSAKAAYILADLNNTLDAAHRRILRQFDDRYADVIGTAAAKMATGVTNTRQAVGEALTAFADNGVDCFIDRGGHHWTMENYSEMAVLTAIERSTISGYVDTMQSYDYDLALIDGHAGSCPICAAWEGVIVSVSGDNPDYPSLGDAENDGCFHPRCLHGITTYYPGITHEPSGGFRNEPREREEQEPSYTARSKQRYMERQIRKYKDRAIVAQTPEQLRQARLRVQQWQDALDDLIEAQPDDNYMYRQRGREITNFARHISNVNEEYASASKPGVGTISNEPGYKKAALPHEREIAAELVRHFGGDVVHINNAGHITKPDIEWRGKQWEIKSSSSASSAFKRIKKAIEQTAKYNGNIIIDYRGFAFEEGRDATFKGLMLKGVSDLDVIVCVDGKIRSVFRYKK